MSPSPISAESLAVGRLGHDGVRGLPTPPPWRQADPVTDVDVDAGAADLTALHLDVYDTRNGPWNPEHGDIEVPDDWEFLPSSDAFITRTVKAAGSYWLSWQPRSRHRRHRRQLGLWAPSEAIRAAEQRAKETADRRAATRTVSARSRARREERYEQDLREAVLRFLDFAPAHAQLAEQIATETAAHAAVVGSGRVGRTQMLSLDEKAALAARAHIRHRHTEYEDRLDTLPLEAWNEDDLYREIKGAAHEAVDAFLDDHRRR
jgi:hypothetical protein